MKVCIDMTPLMNASRFRGIGMYCLELARAVVAAPRPADLELSFLVGGPGPLVRVVPCDEGLVRAWARARSGPLMMQTLYYLLMHTVGWTRLALSDVQLFHSAEPKGTPRPPGRTLLVTCHDLIPALSEEYESWLPLRAREVIESYRYLGVDHAIAISRATRDDLLRVTGWDPDRVSVVYHGIDAAVFQPTAAPDEAERLRPLVGARPYLFYVGAFDRRKQVPLLVRAFCDRLAALDHDLVLAGRASDAQRRRLERLIPASARRRVRFWDYVPADMLPALYRGATAHVLPSTYEGFGMTLTEAFGCGCPVVAAEASCIPEIAAGAALLVPPRDRQALGEAMVRICADSALRAGLRQRGLERARRFTWARCAADTLAVYRKLGASRS